MVNKAYKARIYPNEAQREQFNHNFGCVRFVWNQMLNMQKERFANGGKFINKYGMDKLLTALKKEYKWLSQAESSSLQQATHRLDAAYNNFFDKTKVDGIPKFKKKRYAQSFSSKRNGKNIEIVDNHHIKLPKVGLLYFRTGQQIKGVIKEVTISVNSCGHYYMAVSVEDESQVLNKTGKKIGIDLGLKDLLITSDGVKYNATRFDKNMHKRLRVHERKLARRRHNAMVRMAFDKHNKVLFPRTSLNDFPRYQAERRTVAKLKTKIANQRADYLQKITTDLVKQYDVIVVENLNTKAMMKNKKLARAIANASWSTFITMLEYKCNWYGKTLIKVEPKNTSRICHQCGEKNHSFDDISTSEWLKIRQWQCPNCNSRLDRDINASLNILKRGLAIL